MRDEYIEKILGIAKKMLKGEKNLIIGSREIDSLRFSTPDSENEVFNKFLLIVSDTDHIPVDDEVRKRWNQSTLKELDKELEEYINDMGPMILEACKQLIKTYSN